MPYSLPESTPEYSHLRHAVTADLLTEENPIDYLVLLALEGKRYDGAWDGDDEQLARWVVAQWCQELGWAPDLSAYDAGEQVERGDEIPCCDAVFYGDQEDTDE